MDTSLSLVGYQIGVHFFQPTSGDVDTDLRDNADIDSILLGVYGNYENGRFYLDGMVTYADNSYGTDRMLVIGSMSRTAEGDYDGKEWAFAAELGYVGTIGAYTVQPFLGTRFIRLDEDGFTEEGADDLNLKVDDRTAYSWKLYPGVKVSRVVKTGEHSLFVPELSVRLVRELRDRNDSINASFVGAPAAGSFSVEGVDIARNSIELGAGFKVLEGENFQVGLDFGTEINSARRSYLANVGMKYRW
jgi:outer membrane autotransporter protein